MRRVLTLALLIVVCAAGLAKAAPESSADRVAVKAVPATVTAKAGQRITFDVKLDIERNWHVYAHEDTNSMGIDLFAAEDFPLRDLQVTYPEGHKGEFFGFPTLELDGKQTVAVSILVPDDLAKGEHALELALTVQACDDQKCLLPADVPVKFTLTVE